ncbi:MAG: ABC transporter ATP-binding protein, partial [Pseudomonadota bacterium]
MGFTKIGCAIVGGEVIYKGADLRSMPEEQRRKIRGAEIAYVAQSAAASFNPVRRIVDQSVEVLVEHNGVERGKAEATIVDLLKQLQLPNPPEIARRFPDQVSGGQLQRAMAAMAMAPRPNIIVFDEPTTALDVTTQVEVLAAIKQAVRDFGIAALYISHDLAVVAQMADRIVVLRNGTVVEEGSTRDILSQPKMDYTRSLVAHRSVDAQERAMPGAPLLRATDIDLDFGEVRALSKVSIVIRQATTVAVVGESGSGKTTLARVIAGLSPRASGSLEWKGKPLAFDFLARSREDLRRIQLVYQMPDTALNPKATVEDIVARPFRFYFKLKGSKLRERVRALLNMVELDPDVFMSRKTTQLSGGQKQRLCIARALAAEPDLIICDEVTSALDPLIAQGVLKLLMRLQRELSVAYLFITHDMSTVTGLADEVVVMSKGRIVESGSREDVLTRPQNPYTRMLLDSTPQLDTQWLNRLLDARKQSRVAGGT